MAEKSKLIALLAVCALVAGCGPTQQRKVELLRQIKKCPTADLYFELGRVYQEEKNWYLTEYYYDFAMGFDATEPDSKALRVSSLDKEGNKQEAQALAQTYIGQAGRSAADSLRLAIAFEKQGLDDYALAGYNQALTLAPDSARANLLVSYYYLRANDDAKAKEYLVRSYQLCPKQQSLAGDLGRLGIPMKLP